jgi:hypothetical protein
MFKQDWNGMVSTDFHSSLPKLPWLEQDSTTRVKLGDFQDKIVAAQLSVKNSVRRIKKFKRLLDTDQDETDIEKTEEALNTAEAALSKAAKDLSIAELSLDEVIHRYRRKFFWNSISTDGNLLTRRGPTLPEIYSRIHC